MKRVFTLMAIMLAMLSANAQTVERDLELVGSNLNLPPKYITGRAEFQQFQKWGEVLFFDKEQSDGKTTSAYEIYSDEWPTLHLEFETLLPNIQLHIRGDVDKYVQLDPESLTFDVNLAELGLDPSMPISLIALQSTEKQTETVIITKCVLVNEGGEEMPLYYSVNNSGGWGVKIVGEAKLLSGKVEFLADAWAQLGGKDWCPAELADCTNAIWTIELNEPVATDQLQLIIDAEKTFYLGEFIQPGATTLRFDVNAYHAESSYSPESVKAIQQLRVQVKAKLPEPVFLNVKSVKLTMEGVADGITEVKVPNNSSAPIYNLSGQRVKTPTKGIYIQNGKKFLVK